MNHTVAIPSDFFLKESKAEYYDYQTRLVQELLQNSLDADATVVKLTFDSLGYKCEDNGRGMSQERMVSALLTMGGSVKEVGATGGFGAAKKLLLFAHKSFSIHSNDTFVAGAGLSYRFIENLGTRIGTEIGAVWSNPSDFGSIEGKAKQLLSKCNFNNRAKIYVNGELFTNYATARHAKTVDGLGEVFANKTQVRGENEIFVLHNGLFMFSRYVTDLNRKVILMVSGPSVDTFTQNRDGFKGDLRNKFDDLVTEMTIDKKSIVKPKPRKFILKGTDAFISFVSKKFTISPGIQAAINSVRLSGGDFSPVSFAEAVAQKVEASPVSYAEKVTAAAMATYVRNNDSKVQTDFHFDLADSTFRKVPGKFVPNAGKPKYTSLAQTWKVCVREVLKANGIDQKFVIGFTFSSQAVATYQRKDGVVCYLINPVSEELDTGTKEEKTMKVLTTAIHEVVHSKGCQYHDEDFVREFHNLLVPTLTKGLTWRQIVKQAKQETV